MHVICIWLLAATDKTTAANALAAAFAQTATQTPNNAALAFAQAAARVTPSSQMY